MEKNILICLEKLGIGGVETAVLNQAKAFKKKGYNVVILSKKGSYVEQLKKHEIDFEEYEFKILEKFDILSQEKLIKILKKYKITEIHIHQLPCIMHLLIPSIILDIPYISYLHTSLLDVYEWYENQYSIYKDLLKIYYKNSLKIVAISKEAIKNHSNFYNIPISKYTLKRNSLDFESFRTQKTVKSLNKFMIISRLSNEKEVSIKNAVKLFVEYAKNNKYASLDIWGEGPLEDEIIEFIKGENYINYNINLKGATNEVAKIMDNYDVVIAIGRCILEAIALKKIAIISGNEEIKFLVNKTNIEEAIEKNFASKTLSAVPSKDIVRQLLKLSAKDIKEITNYNYNLIKKRLNIFKNIYSAKNNVSGERNLFLKKIIYDYLIETNNNLLSEINDKIKVLEENKIEIGNLKILEKNQKQQIEELKISNTNLLKELNEIKENKKWQLICKIDEWLYKVRLRK